MSKWEYVYFISCGGFTVGIPLACLVAINIVIKNSRKADDK